MPTPVKLGLSILWLATAAGGYAFMAYLGQRGPGYAAAFLGIFATVAMWVFPEVTRNGRKPRAGTMKERDD